MEDNLNNETERFLEYLIEKQKKYLTRNEISLIYEEFQKLWKQKNNFNKIFDNLRKNKILFLIDKNWCILTKEESLIIKRDKSMYNSIFFQNLFGYFKEVNIRAYFGLASAEYFKGNSWQSPHTFYIINEKYHLKKKIKNQTIIFIKFPEGIIIENAILHKDSLDAKPFSDNEKTFLDKIYYIEYLKGKINLFVPDSLNFEKINLYLSFYKKYPFIRSKLISLLDEEQLKKIR